MTVRQKLVENLLQMFARHGAEEAPPSLVMWPDKDGQWAKLIAKLKPELPDLYSFGPYSKEEQRGPAIWLRCVLAGTLNAPLPSQPVVYLPGVSRADLRHPEDAPRHIQPLIELQFRGIVWGQPNGKDWTPAAFLSQLGLDIASDDATKAAVQERLFQLLESPIEDLAALGRLDAIKIRNLGSDWPSAILAWMEKPTEKGEDWDAFHQASKSQYGFDPQTDGELAAAESLAQANGPWLAVWNRFAFASRRYPRTVALLKGLEPPSGSGLFAARREGYPKINEAAESALRTELSKLTKKDPSAARKRLTELDSEHSERLNWVWCELGHSPLAEAVHWLAKCASVANTALAATSIEELINRYTKWGWEGDLAAWKAYACADSNDAKLMADVLQAIYLPWIQNSAEVFSTLCQKFPLRSLWSPISTPAEGECLLFADGLRYDVAALLKAELEDKGSKVILTARVAGLPSVTATAKPAVSPIADKFSGSQSGAEFRPVVSATGKSLQMDVFRELLSGEGVEAFSSAETGDPSKGGWTEAGAIDRLGHDEGARLAKRIPEEVKMLAERANALLSNGRKVVRIVTDHGWLWMPGGLPKAKLPQYLTESQWGRCAAMKLNSTTELHTVPWHYDPSINIAVPPGISCFRAGMEYSHGGLSLQECIIPVLTVASGNPEAMASIDSANWVGLRCRIKAAGSPGWTADIRTKAADSSSSLVMSTKPLGATGEPTLVVSDEHEGRAAIIVICDLEGRVVAKQSTTIGVNE